MSFISLLYSHQNRRREEPNGHTNLAHTQPNKPQEIDETTPRFAILHQILLLTFIVQPRTHNYL